MLIFYYNLQINHFFWSENSEKHIFRCNGMSSKCNFCPAKKQKDTQFAMMHKKKKKGSKSSDLRRLKQSKCSAKLDLIRMIAAG